MRTLLATVILAACGAFALMVPVRADDVPVLRLRQADAGQFAQLEAALKAAGLSYIVIDEDQLDGLPVSASAPLLAPLTPSLSPQTLESLARRAGEGAGLAVMPPADALQKPALDLLGKLGFALEGVQRPGAPLTLQWVVAPTPSPPAAPNAAPGTPVAGEAGDLPAGTSLLRFSPQTGEMRIIARWSDGTPAIASRGRVTLLNWPWHRALAPRQTAALLARQLAGRSAPPVIAAAAPSPPLAIDPLPKAEPSPASAVSAPPASKPLVIDPLPKAAPSPASAVSAPPLSKPATSLAITPAPPSPVSNALKQPPLDAKPLLPQGLHDATLSSPASALTLLPEKSPDRLAVVKTAADDPLLSDQAMFGAAVAASDAQPSAPAVSTGETLRQQRLSAKIQELAQTRQWLNDALESALAMELTLPVRQIQAQMTQAQFHETAARLAANRKDLGRQEAELDRARQIHALARRMAEPSALVEGRAIWLDRGSILETRGPQGLRRLIDKLADSGLNVIYFESFNAGYPVYPSQVLPQNPLVENWDPLAVAVEAAHKRGMELHAWVWCFAVGNTRHNALIGKPGAYAGPVLDDAGLMGEALRMSNGSNLPPRQTEYWLSPASRRGRDFLLSVYREIVTRYTVDGVHLDYIRYPFQRVWEQAGYEDASRVRFAQESGVSIDKMNDATLKAFIAWKTHQVSSFVQDVSQTLRPLRPGLTISAAVFPMTRAERILAIQQDWETWLNNGWVDALNPMIYTSSRRLFQDAVRRILGDAKRKSFVYPGLALFRLDSGEMLGHLEAIRELGGMGSTLFAYAQLDAAKQEALRLGPYKNRDAIAPHRDPLAALNAEVGGFSRQFARLQNPLIPAALSAAEADAVNQALAQLSAFGAKLAAGRSSASMASVVASDPTRGDFARAAQSLNDALTRWRDADKGAHPYRLALFEDILSRINMLSQHMGLSDAPPTRIARP